MGLGMVRSVSGRSVAGVSGLSLQLCAGAAVVIWPDRAWIAQVVFALGFLPFIGSVCLWFFANYRLRWPAVSRARNHNNAGIAGSISSAHIGGGRTAPQIAPTQSAVPWNDKAHLVLVFDKAMKKAKAVAQENVPYYYWYTLHEIQVEFDTGKFRATPCSVIVFLSFEDPTHTSYHRVYVGDDIECAVLGSNPYGATVWAGDLRGRALDIRFSKTPILTG